MKAYVVFSSKEPVLIVTRHTIRNEAVLKQLDRVEIQKFIAREVPVPYLRSQYGAQFDVIEKAVEKGSDLRVVDYSGRRIFQKLPFSEFGPAYRHDHSLEESEPTRKTPRARFRPDPGSVSATAFG